MSRRIAITVQSLDGLSAPLDPRFGRARAWLLADDAGAVLGHLENDARDAVHGAGTGAAALMGREKVDVVISGEFGPKAFQGLSALGIETWLAPAGITAGEVLERFRQKHLVRKERA